MCAIWPRKRRPERRRGGHAVRRPWATASDRLRNLAAGARAYIERDAKIATQMAILAARIETAVEEQLRAVRGDA